MGILAHIRAIEGTQTFQEWKKENASGYLTSVFSMFSEGEQKEWLVSYSDPKEGKITTFSAGGQAKNEEAFTKAKVVPPLKSEEVHVEEEEALGAAQKALQAHDKGEVVQRTILVLQALSSEAVWNITFITTSLKVVNMKISAVDAREIGYSKASISDFMRKG